MPTMYDTVLPEIKAFIEQNKNANAKVVADHISEKFNLNINSCRVYYYRALKEEYGKKTRNYAFKKTDAAVEAIKEFLGDSKEIVLADGVKVIEEKLAHVEKLNAKSLFYYVVRNLNLIIVGGNKTNRQLSALTGNKETSPIGAENSVPEANNEPVVIQKVIKTRKVAEKVIKAETAVTKPVSEPEKIDSEGAVDIPIHILKSLGFETVEEYVKALENQ